MSHWFPTAFASAAGLASATCLVTAWLILTAELRGQSSPTAAIDFNRDVRPLLSDRCFACHGPDAENRQADLRLDQRESLLAAGSDRPIVAPGNAAGSELIRRITTSDAAERMPPEDGGKPLTAAEIETLIRWVDSGANWQEHWAYQLPQASPLPELPVAEVPVAEVPVAEVPVAEVPVTEPAMAGAGLEAEHWIDRFVAAKLAEQGGQFSPPAETITLIRRLSFDLTGLPPTPTQVAALLADPSPTAIDAYVEQLLASPACGERLASYWLDLVRFADTVGYHGDQDHQISLYRDYVIDALNDNLAFDRFTIEQLAGDLLPNPTDEQIIATGYNRLLQTSHEGGVQAKEYLTMYAADHVRNVSAVWMGATVGCAQCHDHKFDPYTAGDFYALAAFFADIDEAQHLHRGSDSIPTLRAPEKQFLDRRQRLQRERLKQQSQIEALEAAARTTMITVAIPPRTIRLLPRGNWQDDSGPIMAPQIPAFLADSFPLPPHSGERPTRLELARWLVDEQHGVGLLTARVQVNRLWMLLFGQGLSRSVEDFGGQGEPPSHPRLLDRLATEFVRSGWDVKHILRSIVSSRTYRQSSLENQWHRQHDPSNRWLGRQNRFRVPAEMVRDTALAASGLLVRDVGGPSVKPYQPEDYYRHLNFPPRRYTPSTDAGQWRRGVYMHWQRQFLHPMLLAFDAPRREECTAQRSSSNTPLAALVWLNDPSFVEAARALATLALASGSDDRERIASMFQRALSRDADPHERQLLLDLLHHARAEFADASQAAQQLLGVGLLPADLRWPAEELAAWTNVARAVLNVNEAYTRN